MIETTGPEKSMNEGRSRETGRVPAGAASEGAEMVEATAETAFEERAAFGRSGRTAAVAALAIVAVVGLAFLLWWLVLAGGSRTGRPVPAPRMTGTAQAGAGEATSSAPAEATVTLAPEVATRAGIVVEAVGEQLAADATSSQIATGVVQANAYRSTPVVSLVGGIVRSVGAELGQSVRQGQAVAVVFSDELAMAQSKYLAAQAELEEYRRHHERTLKLVAIGAASREELEQATAKMRAAESESAAQRQRLLLLGLAPQRVAALRSASQVSSEVTLPAPVSGTVIARSVNPGEVVEASREILRVADLSNVWVVAQVYEKDLARVHVGSGASVTSEAYPSRIFRGRVSYVDPTIEPATRTAQVRVELANPGQALKIGMYVGIAFGSLGGAEATAPTVPANAVQNIAGRQVVFVATGDPNTFEMRPVRLGAQTRERLPVFEGLTVGERIVTQGSFMLRAEWLKLHPAGGGQQAH